MMYHCSDLVISTPIKAEGFGRIISESLAMKKMIIAYNFGGTKNQLEDLDDIYKITPHNQEELIKLMQKNYLIKCEYRNLSGGIVAIHSGWKI